MLVSSVQNSDSVLHTQCPLFSIFFSTEVIVQYWVEFLVFTAGPYKLPLLYMKWSEVAQSCPTLCDPMDCSLPGSSIHGIFQARVLEWVSISFSRGSSWPRNWTGVSCTAGGFSTSWATREALILTNSCTDTNKLPQLCKVKSLWNIL